MLIVISPPEALANEASLINKLFESGMQLFHLRKPHATKEEVRLLLNEIQPEYRKGVVLNQFYELSEEFGINRFHFSTDKRNRSEHTAWKKEGNVLSTSTHELKEYTSLESCFDYAFLSPVFDSISKSLYKKVQFEIKEKTNVKLIALGGITATNCNEVKQLGFDGIAVLGGIWQQQDPVESFKEIKRVWNIHDQ